MKRAGALLCLCAFLSGCSRFGDYARVLEANRLHARGSYQDAAAGYLSVGSRSFAGTIEYDLGNVYARLGEIGAAQDLYARARRAAGGESGVAADAWFNEGVALYEKGRYEDSWRAFREAIALRAEDDAMAQEARGNLELAWRAWKKSALAPPSSAVPSLRTEGSRDEAEIRLMRRLETGRWRP
ncbi:MAG: tetratricopeptide repeat protein, partial [Spirochaetaceae bacterium]|nr:tetratricopeptide repeat protein [Spirochaetaceae bacterium]